MLIKSNSYINNLPRKDTARSNRTVLKISILNRAVIHIDIGTQQHIWSNILMRS